ncbi:MAG: signal peptide peptidase SppA [Candidatus Cloacimonadia bacterium]
MRTLGKVLLWIFAIIGILTVVFTILLSSIVLKKPSVAVKENTFLTLKLSGLANDYNPYESMPFIREPLSISELCKKIETAQNDPRIKGIIIKPTPYYISGWALTKELRDRLLDFHQAGKKIYAYCDFVGDTGYYVASIADSIFLNPSQSGGIILTGIAAEINYYKGLFDKIGIEFISVHQGEYKGAGEPFSQKTMSEPMRENYTEFIEDMYKEYVQAIAESRGLPLSQMLEIMENRQDLFIVGESALELNLADVLCSEKEFNKMIIEPSNIMDIKKYPAQVQNKSDKIAILYGQGNIILSGNDGFGLESHVITDENIPNELDKIAKRKDVKALVFRVNSEGGSALVSDIVWNALEEVNKKIPVVVSMGDMAASGGYYISCGADYIFAQPNTLTGSIGVVSLLINWEELREKAEINTYQIKKGKYAGFLSPNFSPSQSDIATIERMSEKIYEEFKERVAQGRNMTLEQVEQVAQGRLWTGKRAVDAGLVDELGGLDDAVAKAAELAGIEEYSIILFPQRKGLLDILRKGFDLDIGSGIKGKLNEQTFKLFPTQEKIIEAVSREPVWLIPPFQLDVNY